MKKANSENENRPLSAEQTVPAEQASAAEESAPAEQISPSEAQVQNLLSLPMIPLRGLVIYPMMSVSFDVERPMSIKAGDIAAAGDHLIFLSMQKHFEDDEPKTDEIYTVGTVCRIRQMLRQVQQGFSRLIVEALYRAALKKLARDELLPGQVRLRVFDGLDDLPGRLAA